MATGLRRTRHWILRTVATATFAFAVVVGTAVPAAAGGTSLRPVRDRYEPGETVTLVAYVGPGGTLGSVEDGPFFTYLRQLDVPIRVPNELQSAPFVPAASDAPIGQLTVQNTGRAGYLAYRVSIQVRLSGDLPAGRYGVIYCNATCTKGLSDLIGGVIFVGRDPDFPFIREWPSDEPEIANLDDDAVLQGPGWRATAQDARTGSSEPPTTPAPTTTVPATSAERTAHRASDSDSGGSGPWKWAIPALFFTVLIGASGLVAVTRVRLRR